MLDKIKKVIKRRLKNLLIENNNSSFDPIFKTLSQNKDLHDIQNIVDQFNSGLPYVDYRYKNETIRIINEPGSIYHIANSTSKMEKLANACELVDNGFMLDIGGNIGLFSYFYKKRNPNVSVFIVEPDARLIPIIERNLQGFKNITIINSAVGKEKGKSTLYINSDSSQTNSLVENAVVSFAEKSKIVQQIVDVKTLEEICKSNNITKINTLKIDIQGGEYEVLRESRNILKFTNEALIEVCFLMPDTIELIKEADLTFKKHEIISEVIMGADIKFFN
jgi:FkbM family methyltransferase